MLENVGGGKLKCIMQKNRYHTKIGESKHLRGAFLLPIKPHLNGEMILSAEVEETGVA